MSKAKPKHGYVSDGWIKPFSLHDDDHKKLSEILNKANSKADIDVIIEILEDRTAHLLTSLEAEKTGPKPAEIKAALNDLEKNIEALQNSLNLDEETHEMLQETIDLKNGDLHLMKALKDQLRTFYNVVLLTKRDFEPKKGRPVKYSHQQLTYDIRDILEQHKFRLTKYTDNVFHQTLKTILQATGEADADYETSIGLVEKDRLKLVRKALEVTMSKNDCRKEDADH